MVLGLFFFWHLLKTWRSERGAARRYELALIGGFAFLIGWLLKNAHSATSLACLPVGIVVMVLVGQRWVNKRLIGMYVLTAVIVLLSAELMFHISAYAIELLGRDATLTDRTILWEDLLKQKTNPIFGVGFESFWLGADRLARLHEGRSWQPNEAHNGYLEIYLDLGVVGLFMLVGLLIATFRKICRGLLTNFHFGRFRLGLFAAVVLNNWTEVTFRGPHPIWLLFYIIAMEYPKLPFASVEPAFGATTSEEEMELVHSPDEFGIDSSLGDSRSAISARDI
jgi:exopolysaccharide production protein ExoQ